MAGHRPCNTVTPDGFPFYPMEDHRHDDITDRAVRDDVHLLLGGDQRRIYILRSSDPFHAHIRALGVWLGMSYRGAPGPVCLAFAKAGPNSETIPLAAPHLCADHRGGVYVPLA